MVFGILSKEVRTYKGTSKFHQIFSKNYSAPCPSNSKAGDQWIEYLLINKDKKLKYERNKHAFNNIFPLSFSRGSFYRTLWLGSKQRHEKIVLSLQLNEKKYIYNFLEISWRFLSQSAYILKFSVLVHLLFNWRVSGHG